MNDQKKLGARLLVVPLSCIVVVISVRLHHIGAFDRSQTLPITGVEFSSGKAIEGIRTWRICGPFVVDKNDQDYTPASESRVFNTDYLARDMGREEPLTFPPHSSDVDIDFKRDSGNEPKSTPQAGKFLNQIQRFPTPDVNSQLVYWGAYHKFKVIYAAAVLKSSVEQDVVLLSATNSPVKLWLNGKVQIQSPPGAVGADWYSDVGVKVHLHFGENTLLLKALLFPERNDFSVWIATRGGAQQFINQHGGVFDLVTQVIIPSDTPIRVSPIMSIYDPISAADRYELRDVVGKRVAEGKSGALIDTRSIPDGLYAISSEKEGLKAGEFLFIGDPAERVRAYGVLCAAKHEGLPCDGLYRLKELLKDPEAAFRLDKEKLIVFLISQFEWTIRNTPLRSGSASDPPQIRLMSFRSAIDGTTQHYYMHLSSEVPEVGALPLAVVVPYNTSNAPFFENSPTMGGGGALQKYARFADRYRLNFIAPFARGRQMPSALAEEDVLEAIKDAKGHLNVDDGRLFLIGECAGGRSALLIAEKHPGMFAAVSTVDAASGYVPHLENAPHGSANVLLHLKDLSRTKVNLVQGEENYHSPASQAALLEMEAKRAGVHIQLTLLPGNGQFGTIDPDMKVFEFLGGLTRVTEGPGGKPNDSVQTAAKE